MLNKIIQLRKELHQYPELSGFEAQTAQRIKAFIESNHHPTTIIENLGGHGLAVVYEFPDAGQTVAIRCELDALPIEEPNTFSHQSTIKGVSHKCGHDGHMAIVAGLIFWIKAQNFQAGKIVLLFQPAEETGQGAAKVLEDERFTALNIDYIFALHNIPNIPKHSIITMKQGFSAEVQSFAVYLKGRESHAAEPEKGINPALAISALVAQFDQLNHNFPNDEHFKVLTPVHLNLGQKSYGISPALGELHYTIRTWNTAEMTLLKNTIENTIKQLSEIHKLTFNTDWFEYFPASTNHSLCNGIIKKAAITNNFNLIERPYPFKFGEDFGWFTKDYKTGMFGLGAGLKMPPLHDANYDFPDEIIETGIKIFQEIIMEIIR